MTDAEILAAFDAERRTLAPAAAAVERTERIVRHHPTDGGDGWVTWSAHAPEEIDAAITAEIALWRARGRGFEWKVYAHDRPANLRERLAAHGFEVGAEEAWMVRAAEGFPPEPAGVNTAARRVESRADLENYFAVERVLWPEGIGDRQQRAATRWNARDESRSYFYAVVDGRPAAIGRTDYQPGGRFAGLFGGSTLPEFRGRGLYTALVAARAAEAEARGREFLFVDALPTSRSRLEALGFRRLSTTWPCVGRAG